MYHLVIDRITKCFGEFKALDDVSLHVHKNSIHVILGENGAGKTTLMNVLFGLYQPDEGRIEIDGRQVPIDNPRQAIENSIGMIHQHFMLVKSLSVTENIILGLKGQKASLHLREHEQRVRKLSDSFGFEIDPKEPIWKLPMGMQQRVEILKALYRNAELLILDEPTSVLAPHEVDAFLSGLKRLRDAGHTIIFITHKLDEVMQVADQVTVLRQGRVTAEVAVEETTVNELARLMVGRDVVFDFKRHKSEIGEIALDVADVSATNDRGIQALDQVSLALHTGEILGIAGVDGNGQSELAEVITGLRPLETGIIRIYGKDISGTGIRKRKQEYGIGYIPEDRQNTGLVLDYPVQRVGLVDHVLEAAVGQRLQRRGGQRVAQQALRRHHDQRLAERAQHLAAQQVEDLRRRGRHADLDVVLGAQLQEALEARRGVLRPLALVAVRQQHHQPAEPAPLGLGRGDELVDDHLGAVGEVAELAPPRSSAHSARRSRSRTRRPAPPLRTAPSR